MNNTSMGVVLLFEFRMEKSSWNTQLAKMLFLFFSNIIPYLPPFPTPANTVTVSNTPHGKILNYGLQKYSLRIELVIVALDSNTDFPLLWQLLRQVECLLRKFKRMLRMVRVSKSKNITTENGLVYNRRIWRLFRW